MLTMSYRTESTKDNRHVITVVEVEWLENGFDDGTPLWFAHAPHLVERDTNAPGGYDADWYDDDNSYASQSAEETADHLCSLIPELTKDKAVEQLNWLKTSQRLMPN